ncbi:uncharacterized protein LOC120334056 isoform X2 [Styela clava]
MANHRLSSGYHSMSEFDPKPRITGTMLKFIQKVRSKASDHKDDVEVYSKRRKQKLYQKSERIISSVFTFIFFNFFNPLHKVFPTFDTANPCRVINCDPSDLHRAAARVFWGSGPPF